VFQITKDGGVSPLGRIVDDDFIEAFHDKVGESDALSRKKLGKMNKMSFQIYDSKSGKNLTFEENRVYPLSLDAKYTRYKTLSSSEKSKTSINTGLKVSIPLTQEVGYATAGVSTNIIHTIVVA